MPRIALTLALTVCALGLWAQPAEGAHPSRKHERRHVTAQHHRRAERHERRHVTARHHRRRADRYARRPRHRGYVILHGESASWRGYAVNRHRRVSPKARAEVSRVLASWRTGKEILINRRLIRLLAHVSDHFGGRPIRVVSGYRPYSPTQYTPDSRHNYGKAVDFSIPGVPNTVLFAYCRSLHDVGCGYYPNSTFVHMDVRRMSAFWVDYSGPGQPPRYGPPDRDPRIRELMEERQAEHEHEASDGSQKTSSRKHKKSNNT